MFEPHSSVRSIFINSDKRSPRAGLGSGDWVGVCFNKYFCFNVEEPAVATRIQERRVREFGKSGNVVLLTYYVFSFFLTFQLTIPSRYYQFDIVHIYDNGKIRASI